MVSIRNGQPYTPAPRQLWRRPLWYTEYRMKQCGPIDAARRRASPRRSTSARFDRLALAVVWLLALVLLGSVNLLGRYEVGNAYAAGVAAPGLQAARAPIEDGPREYPSAPAPAGPVAPGCHHALCHLAPALPVSINLWLALIAVLPRNDTRVRRYCVAPPIAPPPQLLLG